MDQLLDDPPINDAVVELRRRGWSVEPDETRPGLWFLNGEAVTSRQIWHRYEALRAEERYRAEHRRGGDLSLRLAEANPYRDESAPPAAALTLDGPAARARRKRRPRRHTAVSRFEHGPRKSPQDVKPMPADHPAAVLGHTRYQARVKDPGPDDNIFKQASNTSKIGSPIQKGRLKGLRAYTLSLEERATCPRSCDHWLTCYGNSSNWGVRWRHGPVLEDQIERHLGELQEHNPDGFLVRLHQLGDFYAVYYVDLWEKWLGMFPGLYCYGYTARKRSSDIGVAIERLVRKSWRRFAIRFSNYEISDAVPATSTLYEEPQGPRDSRGALICPEQRGKTLACATCGLCWAGEDKPAVDRIVFILH